MEVGHIKMSQKEAKRVTIIDEVLKGKTDQKQGAKSLNMSVRQIRRVVKRVKEEGIEGHCHRSRGRKSPRQISSDIKSRIIQVYKAKYADFGPTFAQEKLVEREHIQISRESLRKLLIKEGLWIERSKKNRPVHVWRQRRSSEGELVQVDGSHHRWLEDRLEQEFCLMAYIDDATSKVYGRFYEYEGVYPGLDSFRRFINEYGCPHSIYIDRHSTYKTTRKASIEEDLKGESVLTQFEHVMQELEVQVIHARSPQAKGRVERLFKTLQDRLVKEMRLAEIDSIPNANLFLEEFLETYNQRFTVHPKIKAPVWHPMPAHCDLTWTFSKRYFRTILKDYTIQWQNKLFLLENPSLALKGQRVEIRVSIDGLLRFSTKNKVITVKSIQKAPKQTKIISMAESKRRLDHSLQSHTKSKKSWMDGFYFGDAQKQIHSAQPVLTN